MSTSIRILDGGLGTDLFINGGYNKDTLNDDPLWLSRVTYENPSAVKNSHMRFIEAGCDIITTGSYQASVAGYMEHAKLSREQAENVIASSVDIARKAIDESAAERKIYIAGSISPYGAILHDLSEYTGSYIDDTSYEKLRDYHFTNVHLLASKGVDMLAFETLPALKEALVLVDLLKQYPNCKAWISFTTKDGIHTSYGDPFVEVFQTLAKYPQVFAIGSNCFDSNLTKTMLECAKKSISSHQKCIIYPDNWKCANEVVKSSPLLWLPEIKEWLDTRMVSIVGGCCMTTPININQIKKTVRDWEQSY
ncbi:uncharacterized protein LOC143462650 isoform X2 [Clavelina lepadiformis]